MKLYTMPLHNCGELCQSKRNGEHMTDTRRNCYLIRPFELSDAPALLDLILQSSGGLSSLQPRLDFLRDYIQSSVNSFGGRYPLEKPHKYLLGMFEHGQKIKKGGRLIGCSAVKTQIGIESPFINFDLQGDGENQVLRASTRFRGATEVGSLFLHPDYRDSGLGRYLAKVRYHLIGAEPWRFGDMVIAELRGICGKEGSPLYDHLFEYKLDKTFLEADAEYFDRDPKSLGDIVPIGDVPTYDFPIEVKMSLAQPHPTGIGAMRLLQREGFIFSGTIDLFDAGPIMSVHRDTIRTTMQTKTLPCLSATDLIDAQDSLISVGTVADFRAVVTPATEIDRGVLIPQRALDTLGVEAGAQLRFWQDERRLRKGQSPQTQQVKA